MDIEKIEKFIDAGFTKDEISALLGNAAAKSEESGENTPPKSEESNEQGAENPAHDSKVEDVAAMFGTLTETVKGLQETVKALQAANAKNANSQGAKVGDPIKDIMDSFINTL